MAQLKGTLSARGRLVGSIAKSSGGTWNYPDLENLPQINGVTLIDNKTSEELGIIIPTKTSDLENDSEFVTSDALPTKTSDLENDSGFVTSDALPTHTSDLENDSGFITSDALPTKTSELENDSGFVTSSDIPTKVSELENDSNYATRSELPTNTSDLYNDSGFITSSALPTKTSDLYNDSGYVTMPDVILGIIDDTHSDDDSTYSSDKIDAIIDALLPIDEASGTIATFSTDLAKPLVSLKANVDAVQESGTPTPSTPKAISGWSAVKITRCGKNLYSYDASKVKSGTTTAQAQRAYFDLGLTNCTLSFSGSFKSGVTPHTRRINIGRLSNGQLSAIYEYIANGTVTPRTVTYGATERAVLILTLDDTEILKSALQDMNLQVENSSSATAYEAYTGTEITINLGDTIYGGVLDVKNDMLRVTKRIKTFNDCSWTSSTWGSYTAYSATLSDAKSNSTSTLSGLLCEIYPEVTPSAMYSSANEAICLNGQTVRLRNTTYSTLEEWEEATKNYKFVYPLATPIEISLSDIPEITTLIGTNNIFADSGNVEVKFKESIQKYIDDKIAETQALIL